MTVHFASEIGRMRAQEMAARAERYRRTYLSARPQELDRSEPRPDPRRMPRLQMFRWRPAPA